ncbi:MAG: hypothetical protein ABH878_04935 [bacterium]
MSADLWMLLIILFVLLPLILLWAYKKRHRLFFSAKFTAETTMMNYQDQVKRAAMEAVQVMNEEALEDDSGEKKEPPRSAQENQNKSDTNTRVEKS